MPEADELDALIALLAAHGRCTPERLAGLLSHPRWLVSRRLRALWLEDLVSAEGHVWRLTKRGWVRARELRRDEERFEWLIRTRVRT